MASDDTNIMLVNHPATSMLIGQVSIGTGS